MSSSSVWATVTAVVLAGAGIATRQLYRPLALATASSPAVISDVNCDDGPPVRLVAATTPVVVQRPQSSPDTPPQPQTPPPPPRPARWSKFNDAEYQALGLPTPPGVPHVDVQVDRNQVSR